MVVNDNVIGFCLLNYFAHVLQAGEGIEIKAEDEMRIVDDRCGLRFVLVVETDSVRAWQPA